MAAGRSVILILNLICALCGCGNSLPSVVTAARNLFLDCPCIYATEVNEDNRGVFSVNSSNPRFSRSDCVLIFVMGTVANIVQLELKDVQLQPNCAEYVELFPYLKEPVIENTTIPEYTMCHSHFKRNASLNYAPEEVNEIVSRLDDDDAAAAAAEEHASGIDGSGGQLQQQLFSGGRIYGLRVIFKPPSVRDDSVAFYIRGEYAFMDKANFENDGRLIPGTYCDYYFFAEEGPTNETSDVWKYFHSPRYPANYAAHIQCTYKFIGRPDTRVEVVFDELVIPTNKENCNSDKVTIYDAESPNVSSIIDVICETVHNKRILSNGPDLLIDFNASSNHTAKGFRGKFKFVDATKFKKDKIVIVKPKLNEVLFHLSHAMPRTAPTGSGSSSPLVSPLANCISSKLNYKTKNEIQ